MPLLRISQTMQQRIKDHLATIVGGLFLLTTLIYIFTKDFHLGFFIWLILVTVFVPHLILWVHPHKS